MKNHRLSIPVDLLLRLYQAAPSDVKAEIEAMLGAYKQVVDRKGHVAEGFRKIGDDLIFDEQLYDEAVYRGKVQTYGEVARERLKTLKETFDTLQEMASEQRTLAAQLSLDAVEQRVGRGEPISADDQKLLARVRLLLGGGDA